MNKPRILLVSKLYHPWVGGVEQNVQDLAEGLRDEFDIRVLCCNEIPGSKSQNPQLINGIAVYKVPSLGIYWSMPIAPRFPFWLKKLAQEADIIHYHLPFPLATISHFLVNSKLRIKNSKFIISWHSAIVRQKVANIFLKPWTKRLLNRANAIAVSSERLKSSSEELAPFYSKCRTIPLGINPAPYEQPENFKDSTEEIRAKYNNAPLILCVGRLVPYKGAEYLIRAMRAVNSGAQLLLIGEGPLRDSLQNLATQLHLQNRIHFLGKLEGKRLIAFYHACDFFVLPSITANEAFGLVQLEAMACGKPVINTNLPTGVPWVSLGGETGLTVEPGNSEALSEAINKLLSDAPLRKKLGAQAKTRVQHYFTKSAMCEQFGNLYHDLLKTK